MAETGYVKKILKQDNCYIIVEATMNNWVGLDTFIQKSVYLMSIFIPGLFSSFFRYKQAQIVTVVRLNALTFMNPTNCNSL